MRMIKRYGLCLLSIFVSLFALTAGVLAAGTRRSNQDDHNYSTWSYPVYSYLTETSGGGYMAVQYSSGGSSFLVEYYDADMKFKSSKEIDLELALFGGFYEDSNGYYILTGQSNSEESADVECYRVTKYDKSWNRKGSCGLKNCNTVMPFSAGSASMDSSGNLLFVHTCHTMYKSSDGLNHQSNLSMVINTSAMTVTGSRSSVSYEGTGYCSHSFNQYVRISDDGYVFTADHGDAYPRAVMVSRYKRKIDNTPIGYVDYYEPFTFTGDVGLNKTGASIGGLELSGSKCIVAGNSINQSNFSSSTTRNIFVATVDFSSGKTGKKWLTSIAEGTKGCSTPFLVKISDSSFVVIWNIDDQVYYAFIDASGNIQGSVLSGIGMLSDCQPIVSNGRILWFTYDGHNTNFYAINISDKSFESLSPVDLTHTTIEYEYEQIYTGDEVCPEFNITYGGRTLVNGTDYTVTYTNNTDIGYGKATIEGIGKFCGSLDKQFYINRADISAATVAPVADLVFSGRTVTPEAVVTFNGRQLVYNTDYSLMVDSNYTVGDKNLTVYGRGNFTGKIVVPFKIVPADVKDLTYSAISDYYYSGSAVTPSFTMKLGSRQLIKGDDYTAEYSDNINAGEAKILVTGLGNYTGTHTLTFNINPASASGFTLTSDSSAVYTGSAIKPHVTVMYRNVEQTEGVDYEVSYSSNINVGTARIDVTGKGNFFGTKSRTFSITPRSITNAVISDIPDQTYAGTAVKPSVSVKDGNKALVSGTDYTVSYYNCTGIGTATVRITGTGNYTGSKDTTFKIVPPVISVGSISNKTYTGSAIVPQVTVTSDGKTLTAGTDYTVSYSNNINAGTASVTVTGNGIYTGSTATASFKIVAKTISGTAISSISDQTYTGSAIKPSVTVKDGTRILTSGTDYTVGYSNNINVGTATVTITGKGNYKGTNSTTFEIVKAVVPSISVDTISAQTYTGYAITPTVTVKSGSTTLTNGTHYTVSYTGNVDAGTATATVTGIGKYEGATASATFVIKPKPVSGLTVSQISAYTYTGSAIKPSVTVKDGSITLASGKDYTIGYSGNINAGTATLSVVGKGNYTGAKNVSFTILAKSLSNAVISDIASQTYSGSAIKPSVTVKDGTKALTAGTDYTVSYTNNVNAGTATVTVTGKGNYKDTASASFTISPKKVSTLTVSSVADQTYTGSPIKPSPAVKDETKTLTQGTDYTLSYANNTAIGTASITVKGKGNYTGSRKIYFNIVKEVITYQWKQSGSKWYYVGSNGVNATGFWNIDGKTYYFNNSGVMLTKWQEIDGAWYYFATSGEMKTGWQKISKVWYYFDASGKMATGLKKIDGVNYYFKDSGAMGTGWIQVGEVWYYFASSGEGKTGWQQISKVWYYFDSDSRMAVGFREIEGKTYFFKDSGAMAAKKWIQDGEDWYWFKSDGSMAVSETVKISGKAYNFDDNGVCLNP